MTKLNSLCAIRAANIPGIHKLSFDSFGAF